MTKARICVPVCARTATESAQLIERARRFAQLVELRLDCLDEQELDAVLRHVLAELSTRQSSREEREKTFILTFRPSEQGGKRSLVREERIKFWRRVIQELGAASREVFADVELDLFEGAGAFLQRDGRAREVDGEHFADLPLICSHHDFQGVPSNLEDIYERMTRTPASVLKIAVSATSILDCVPVFRLLERARREGRSLIAVAMGEAGVATRVLGPSRGAYLTYGSLGRERATAPGQLSAGELQNLYRVETIDGQTLITGLVGSPVAHSVSPDMHNAALGAKNVNGVYIPFEVGDLAEFVRRMVHPRTRELEWNLRGLSVTAPHKTEIMKRLDWIDARAREIGAVNTVVIEGDALRGYNTDAEAAMNPLREVIELRGARVAVLGAGGAARALLRGLRVYGAHAAVFARNDERARAVAREFDAQQHMPLKGARFDGFDVVVNATPLGTHGRSENETPATAAQLRGARVLYDLVYNPSETRLMREARAARCVVIGGLPMLVAQAAEQFRLWTGLDAPVELMKSAAEKHLSKSVAPET